MGYYTAALRFFFVKTLKRPYPLEELPYPKSPRRLPIILSQEEVVALINSAKNLYHRGLPKRPGTSTWESTPTTARSRRLRNGAPT